MEREGVLSILKCGDRFDVTFCRYDRPGGVMSPCKVAGHNALAKLLVQKIHIMPEAAEGYLRQLETKEAVEIPRTRLTDDERFELGLVAPDEGLTPS